jgi:thiol-disulfide isomerase/thioredoxin
VRRPETDPQGRAAARPEGGSHGAHARAAGVAILGALAALLALNVVTLADRFQELRPKGAGDPAPAVVLHPLDEHGPGALADLRGKVVLIDFWASWCAPCRASMPALERLWQRFRAAGLEVVSVNVEGDAAKARAFAAGFRPPLTFPLYVDDGRAAAAFHADAIPHLVLVDRQGIVRLVHVGGADEDELADRIAALLR